MFFLGGKRYFLQNVLHYHLIDLVHFQLLYTCDVMYYIIKLMHNIKKEKEKLNFVLFSQEKNNFRIIFWSSFIEKI